MGKDGAGSGIVGFGQAVEKKTMESTGGIANRMGLGDGEMRRRGRSRRKGESRWQGATNNVDVGEASLEILGINGERAENGVQLIPIR
jgi:hypothetical protein